MAYLGNQPLLSTMRTVAEGTAYAGQTEIPVPGGVISGLNDVIIGGSELGSGDYDDTNGASIELNTPMVAGTMFKVVAWTPNQTVVNAGGQLAGFRNRLINGVPLIRQRGDTFSVGGSYTYTHDRWMALAAGANFSLTVGQGPDAQANVCSYITGAASNTLARLQQRVESLNCLDFAVTGCTFSTRVYSSTTRTVSLYIYTPSATDNHAVQNVQVAQGFVVQPGWTTLKVSTAASAEFTKGSAVMVDFGAVTAGQVVAMTGSQLEPGPVATQFEVRPFGIELLLCQRYFCKTFPLAVAPANAGGTAGALTCALSNTTSGYFGTLWTFPTTMRSTPSITPYSHASFANGVWVNGSNNASSAFGTAASSDRSIFVVMNNGSPFSTPGDVYYVHVTAAAEL